MSQRLLRVNELLKRELSTYISKEFDFLNVLVSVHSVEVAPNLQSARVFVGVIGDPGAITRVIAKLNHNRVAMQSYLGKRVTMRYTPRLEFRSDDSVERGVRIVSLLDSLADESEPNAEQGGEESSQD